MLEKTEQKMKRRLFWVSLEYHILLQGIFFLFWINKIKKLQNWIWFKLMSNMPKCVSQTYFGFTLLMKTYRLHTLYIYCCLKKPVLRHIIMGEKVKTLLGRETSIWQKINFHDIHDVVKGRAECDFLRYLTIIVWWKWLQQISRPKVW